MVHLCILYAVDLRLELNQITSADHMVHLCILYAVDLRFELNQIT